MSAKPPSHARHVGARFSAAAMTYGSVSSLQDRVARRVLELVPDDFSAATVLDAGCGTGRLMQLARARWPDATVTGLDIAPGMIAEARRQAGGDARMQWATGDILDFQHEPFDLVLSSSALHWLRPFDAGLARVMDLVAPGGLAALGIMLEGTLAELHAARRAVVPAKQPAGRLPSMEELEDAARQLSSVRVRRIERTVAEYDQADAEEVLRTVHAMGVTGGDVSHGGTPLNRTELRALVDHYNRHFASPGGVRVTFVVGYLLLERT